MSFGDSQIIIFQTEDGTMKIDVKMENETVWLTQARVCVVQLSKK